MGGLRAGTPIQPGPPVDRRGAKGIPQLSSVAQFIRICRRHPNIRLWFSGHFHLSHNYRESISTVGTCAFVQTGVIGNGNRGKRRKEWFRGLESV